MLRKRPLHISAVVLHIRDSIDFVRRGMRGRRILVTLPCKSIFAIYEAMKRLFLLLSILCVAGTALHAYNFRTVEARHGLSDNYVKDIARDSAGYVYRASTASTATA